MSAYMEADDQGSSRRRVDIATRTDLPSLEPSPADEDPVRVARESNERGHVNRGNGDTAKLSLKAFTRAAREGASSSGAARHNDLVCVGRTGIGECNRYFTQDPWQAA